MPSRLLPLALAAGAVLMLAFSFGCDESDSPSTPSASPSSGGATAAASAASAVSTGTGSALKLPVPPAKRYSLNQDDLGTGFITDIGGSGDRNIEQAGADSMFDNAQDGKVKLAQWGFQDAYRAGYIPEGRIQTLLNGGYAVQIDTYLFVSQTNAKLAYDYIDNRTKGSGAKTVNASQVGDQSVVRLGIAGTFPNSNVEQAIHTIVMRRLNMVVVVQTIGAEPFMRADTVVALANIVDGKATGKRPIVEPTPLNNFVPPVYPTRSTTPAPSASAQGR